MNINKERKVKLNGTTIAGLTVSHPRIPSLILGDDAGYIRGDILDANAVAYKINEVVGGAVDSLDTLKEIAEALGNDPDIITKLSQSVSNLQTWYNNLKGLTFSHINHGGTAKGDNNPTFKAYEDRVEFNYDCFTMEKGAMTSHDKTQFPVASTTLAGVIRADDYKKIDDFFNGTSDTDDKVNTYQEIVDFLDGVEESVDTTYSINYTIGKFEEFLKITPNSDANATDNFTIYLNGNKIRDNAGNEYPFDLLTFNIKGFAGAQSTESYSLQSNNGTTIEVLMQCVGDGFALVGTPTPIYTDENISIRKNSINSLQTRLSNLETKANNLTTYTHIHHKDDDTDYKNKSTFTATVNSVTLNFLCTDPNNGKVYQKNPALPVANATQAGIITADTFHSVDVLINGTIDGGNAVELQWDNYFRIPLTGSYNIGDTIQLHFDHLNLSGPGIIGLQDVTGDYTFVKNAISGILTNQNVDGDSGEDKLFGIKWNDSEYPNYILIIQMDGHDIPGELTGDIYEIYYKKTASLQTQLNSLENKVGEDITNNIVFPYTGNINSPMMVKITDDANIVYLCIYNPEKIKMSMTANDIEYMSKNGATFTYDVYGDGGFTRKIIAPTTISAHFKNDELYAMFLDQINAATGIIVDDVYILSKTAFKYYNTSTETEFRPIIITGRYKDETEAVIFGLFAPTFDDNAIFNIFDGMEGGFLNITFSVDMSYKLKKLEDRIAELESKLS